MSRLLYICLLLLAAQLPSYSQLVTPVTINSASGTSGSGGIFIDWNIGDIAITTVASGSVIVTQGFLQNQIGFPTGVSANPFASYEVKFLPNPTTGLLRYQLAVQNRGLFTMVLYDLNGKMLLNKQFQHSGGNQNGEIDLMYLPSASYQLLIRFEPSAGLMKQSVYTIQKLN
jgi:hypothetical protein